MRLNKAISPILLVILAQLLGAAPALAGHTSTYVEDFTTATFNDTGLTTAYWDTTSGVLTLYPFPMSMVWSLPSDDESLGLAVVGDYIYLADHDGGFKVIDRRTMSVVATQPTPDQTRGLDAAGDYVFVGVRTAGVFIYDVSDPTNPVLAGTYTAVSDARMVRVAGNFAFVANANNLLILDISDPTNPFLTEDKGTSGTARYVDIAGNHAYIADGNKGMAVVDFSDPTNPQKVAQYITGGIGNGIFVDGDITYLADGPKGLTIFDTSDPESPDSIGSFNTTAAFDVVVDGTICYVADESDGFYVLDVTDPTAPALIDNFVTPGDGLAIRSGGRRLFLGDGFDGLKVFHVRDPRSEPVENGTIGMPGPAARLWNHGRVIFAAGSFGLETIDAMDPTSPSSLGSLVLGTPNDIAIDEDYAFVADADSGLYVVDITDPAVMSTVDRFVTPGTPTRLQVDGDYVFIADMDSGMAVVDVTDPGNVSLISSTPTVERALDVEVSGDLAFIVTGQGASEGHLQVFDVSDPTAPATLATQSLGAFGGSHVMLDGDRLYVVRFNASNYDLRIYDVEDPSNPVAVATLSLPGQPLDLTRTGDILVAAGAELILIDVSDAANPAIIGNKTLSSASALTLVGDYAMVSDGTNITTYEVFERTVDPSNDSATSIDVSVSDDDAVKIKMVTTQVDSVQWEISGDGGSGWSAIQPDGIWQSLTPTTGDLRWRATLVKSDNGVIPEVSSLQLDWLYEFPIVESIVDVPDDQGGVVEIEFTRSGYDFAGETGHPLVDYKIWRRVDSSVSSSWAGSADAVGASTDALRPRVSGSAANGFPPGTWETVVTVAPAEQQEYTQTAPTVVDSGAGGTLYSVFVVSAHTDEPSTYWVSPPDSAYSVNNIAGAQWAVNRAHLLQDNFAEDGTTTGTVRMDNAYKKTGSAAGDEMLVRTLSPTAIDYHIPGDDQSGPAVYCHVKDVSPGKSGSTVSGDTSKWPVVATSEGWTVIQFSISGQGTGYVEYSVDLNDSLYTPGDTIYYYFSARDTFNVTNYWSLFTDVTEQETAVRNAPNEVTCLPANALTGGTDILYINDYNGSDAAPFFNSAFASLGITPDRFDVMAPTDGNAGGPGPRVIDVVQQLITPYKAIMWNSGTLPANTLQGSGVDSLAPFNDFSMIETFLDQNPDGAGIYITGNSIAEEWGSSNDSSAVALRNTFMDFSVLSGDHLAIGEPSAPSVVGQIGSPFVHEGTADVMIATPDTAASDYDVLQPGGSALVAMAYSNDPAHGAVLTQVTANSAGDTARVVLSGFSFHEIRDDVPQVPSDRIEHLADIIRFLCGDTPLPTGIPSTPSVLAGRLEQNYPNPFNPTTTIRYSIEEPGYVTLRIYNVAGQLVRTLVDQVQEPNAFGFSVTWDGTDRRGAPVSTGVYFYRLTTARTVDTRKMLLIK